MAFELQSEKFAPTGGIGGEGATRALGRPRLSRLEVLVREAVQNSLDARVSPGRPVSFEIDYRELDARALRALQGTLFEKRPADAHLPLAGVLSHDSLEAVYISDRGTHGLRGPTRTDAIEREADPRNFIDFFRNVGRFGTQSAGGGTYGFGKGSLYVASAARTIVVHTRIHSERGPRSRLMAAALGPQFSLRRKGRLQPFTGRHWWGVAADDGVVEPLEGAEADRLAERLGFPGFQGDETGTTIMIVAPDLDDTRRTGGQGGAKRRLLASRMREVLMWYCWPHMVAAAPSRLNFKVMVDGEPLPGPEVQDHPQLRFFAIAYRALGRANPAFGLANNLKVYDVECGRPVQSLGKLGLVRTFGSALKPERDDEDGSRVLESVPEGLLRHVALMRGPRLVVRYEEQVAPADGAGFAGVFVTDDAVNTAFAESEPVTHDEWNPNSLPRGSHRTFVRVALSRVHDHVRAYLAPPSESDGPDAAQTEVGVVSRALASLVSSGRGPGAEAQPVGGRPSGDGGGGGGGGGRSPAAGKAELFGSPRLVLEGSQKIAIFDFRYKAKSSQPLKVQCEPRVLTADGHSEKEGPQGAPSPIVRAWSVAGRPVLSHEKSMNFAPGTEGIASVSVLIPDGTAVAVELTVAGSPGVHT